MIPKLSLGFPNFQIEIHQQIWESDIDISKKTENSKCTW